MDLVDQKSGAEQGRTYRGLTLRKVTQEALRMWPIGVRCGGSVGQQGAGRGAARGS